MTVSKIREAFQANDVDGFRAWFESIDRERIDGEALEDIGDLLSEIDLMLDDYNAGAVSKDDIEQELRDLLDAS